MESKKINQLATNVAPQTSDLTIIGDPITGVSKKITLLQIANLFATTGTVTSVAVTETGDALTITGSPITSAGTINIGFAGDATQYVRGDGALADFPTSTGGGSSVSYYLNSSVSQGTIGGVAYRELSKDPISGAGTDITISANGYVASYITDANDPALLEVPGGNFNCEFYFSVNSNAHNPYVYAELYKYDGTTFTLLGSSQSVPEYLSNGTTLSPYYFAIPVATAVLSVTDRLAIRIYVNVDGRVVTLHTENNHLCQVVTTFSKGLTSLNNLTRQVQFLATGTSGTDFAISSSTATHTFNLPVASATNTGKLSSTDWSTFNAKQPAGNYVTLDTTQTITGDKTYSGVNTFDTYQTRFSAGIAINQTLSGGAVSSHTVIGANVNGLNVNFPAGGYNSLNFASTSAGNTYTFPNATGTIALTSQLTGGTVTSVGLSSATSGVTIGSSPITTSGTITLAIATASGSQNGLLSSTDWTTFNGKQAALNGTGFVKISGTTISYDNSTYLTTSAAASTYLALSGGTLTGTLTGTNARFSGDATIGSTAAALSPLQVVATGTIVRLGEQSGTTGKQFLIGIDATSGRTELQSVWQGTGFTSLALQPSGGNVLIGTTTDNGAKLQVTTTSTNAGLRVTLPANANATVLSSVDGSGYGWQLQQEEVSTGDFRIFRTNANISNQVLNLARSTGAATFSSTITSGDITTNGNNKGLYFNGTRNAILGNASTEEVVIATANATRMTINSSGNVGIGTSSPSQKLTIDSSGGYPFIDFKVSGTGYGDIGYNTAASAFTIGAYSTTPMAFYTNSSERMRITSSGDVLMGKSAQDAAVDGLQYRGAAPGLVQITRAGGEALQLWRYTSNGKMLVFYYAGSEVGSISSNSNSLPSDLNFKKDISNISLGLNLITKLRPVHYRHKLDDDNEALSNGIIAQELEQALSDCGIEKNSLLMLQHKPNDKEGESQYWVDYTKMIPILIKSIQELQAKIVTLESKIN